MSVKGRNFISVVDNNVDTVAVACVGSGDDRTRSGSHDRLACAVGLVDIDTLVEIACTALLGNSSVSVNIGHIENCGTRPDKALGSPRNILICILRLGLRLCDNRLGNVFNALCFRLLPSALLFLSAALFLLFSFAFFLFPALTLLFFLASALFLTLSFELLLLLSDKFLELLLGSSLLVLYFLSAVAAVLAFAS